MTTKKKTTTTPTEYLGLGNRYRSELMLKCRLAFRVERDEHGFQLGLGFHGAPLERDELVAIGVMIGRALETN